MRERILFNLAPGWALGADKEQWIVYVATARKPGDKRPAWSGRSFVGSTKAILDMVIGELGIKPTPEAQAALDALPNRFLDWRSAHW